MKRTLLTSEAILAFLLMSCSQGSGLSSTLSSLGENSLSEGETAVQSVPAIDYSPERSTIGIPGAGLVTSSLSYYLGYDDMAAALSDFEKDEIAKDYLGSYYDYLLQLLLLVQ